MLLLFVSGCGEDDASSTGTGGSSGTGGAAGSAGSGGSAGSAGGAAGSSAAFDCLGAVKLPTTTDKQGDLAVQVLDGVSNQPVGAGFVVKACPKSDTTCAKPDATATTDAQGKLALTLPLGPNGYDGFGEITGSGYLTTLLYLSRPIIPDPSTVSYFLVATEAAVGLFAQGAGVQVDPAKGQVVVWTHGCDGKLTGGVSLELDGGATGTLAYLNDAAVSTSAKETDSKGIAYVFNAEPGALGVTARRLATGEVFGKTTVQLRAKTATALYFHPTP